MPIAIETVKEYLDDFGMRYMEVKSGDPAVLLMNMTGDNGSYAVAILLEVQGKFLQFRTQRLTSCPKGHQHCESVLGVLGAINYRQRFLKLAWDPSDGEILAYGDIWIADGSVTKTQFHTCLGSYLVGLDRAYRRVQVALFTGRDAGEEEEEEDGI